jgi:hypothetical protein
MLRSPATVCTFSARSPPSIVAMPVAQPRQHRPVSEEPSPAKLALNKRFWAGIRSHRESPRASTAACGAASARVVDDSDDGEIALGANPSGDEPGDTLALGFREDVAAARDDDGGASEHNGVSSAGGAAEPRADVALCDDAPFVVTFPDVQAMPTCVKCKCVVDTLRAKIASKGQGSWMCNNCNTKGTQLRRIYGAWPPASFKLLSEQVVADFWQSIKGLDGGPKLEEVVVGTLVKRKIESEVATVGGEYLPLSVWSTRGYDVADIQEKCTDTEENTVLGTCYRVPIRAVYTKTVEELVRQELRELKNAKTARDSTGTSTRSTKRKRSRRATTSTSSRSNTSGNSTSSSSSDKKKKRKKTKKGKKASTVKKAKKTKKGSSDERSESSVGPTERAKREKARMQEAKRARDKEDREKQKAVKSAEAKKAKCETANFKLGNRVLAKVTPLIVCLKNDLSDGGAASVPNFAAGPAKKSLAVMEKYQAWATKVISVRGAAAALDCTLDTVEAECKKAVESSALFAKLLATAKAHSG